jgi:hypothetical protein
MSGRALADIIGFGPVTVRDAEGRVLRRISVQALLARPRPSERPAPPVARAERQLYADVPPMSRAKGFAGTRSRARARTARGVVVAS